VKFALEYNSRLLKHPKEALQVFWQFDQKEQPETPVKPQMRFLEDQD
jgi:hypothetical protein